MKYTVGVGDKYKHNEGSIITIRGMATHSESREGLVVYFDEVKNIWAMPVDLFFGYLDDGRKRYELIEEED